MLAAWRPGLLTLIGQNEIWIGNDVAFILIVIDLSSSPDCPQRDSIIRSIGDLDCVHPATRVSPCFNNRANCGFHAYSFKAGAVVGGLGYSLSRADTFTPTASANFRSIDRRGSLVLWMENATRSCGRSLAGNPKDSWEC